MTGIEATVAPKTIVMMRTATVTVIESVDVIVIENADDDMMTKRATTMIWPGSESGIAIVTVKSQRCWSPLGE